MKKYSLFFRKLFLFFIVVVTLDFATGRLLDYLYFKQTSGLFYRTTYAMERTTANVLIFGSSRANHHYNPLVFQDKLKTSYYNAGRDGNSLFYHYGVLKSVVKRYKPKMIVLDFNPQEFAKTQESYDRISSLSPYYRSHPEVRDIVNLKSPFEKYKMTSGIYPFNSSLFTIVAGCLPFNKKRANDIEGYMPLSKKFDKPMKETHWPANYPLDTIKVNLFKEFITICKTEKIALYIASSPYYIKASSSEYSIEIAKSIAKQNNVPFFDFLQNESFLKSPELFSDPSHLNDQGAVLYSTIFLDSIAATSKAVIISK